MSTHTAKSKRVRFAPLAIATSIAAAALLSVSMSGTLSGFVASISNTGNTAASGSLVMEEKSTGASPITCLSTDGGSISTNTATCATINKFGGSTTMVPGQTVTTAITLKNTGTVAANTFTLTPGATCSQSNNVAAGASGSATDFCGKLNVVITSGGTTVFTGTAATLAGSAVKTLNTAPVTPGTSTPFSIAVTLDSSATNAYQGLSASLPLTWTFAS
ncbi:hypothetical protein C5C36_16640 [Rathayibacter sp. AY1G1]|uniref:hypothetical protein n=3 Tax=Rathayibacter TaxID=33886 RepID=UPI000CE88676|nr:MULTISPECIES: hypothetical protein [unclassified Rathayibacter]PPF25444.1 hypothetical protein C5C54_14760 [Rathayibacter sp. AY1F2]PPF33018.1 hypothetical protein C5C10_11230 [Rathayibacter sp. AY1A3]PPF54603.1 hypothetical protein C5C55_11910 [Rathayibacter sp. AY1C2]PPG00843.1 hypothetical protein C5C26_16695 [Rathayibacter sp. AY2B1]PPG26941.1 hypothetical protein C5C25_14285 [Rathayibacter sp. AY2B9]